MCLFFFKQKTAYEMRISDWIQTCALPISYNWPPEDGSAPETYAGGRNFGHLAYRVDDIYATCQRLMDAGVTINRPPRDGHMAFVRSPDGISVELLQEGTLDPAEPWASTPNTGRWAERRDAGPVDQYRSDGRRVGKGGVRKGSSQ